jgi:hypothetical protein
MGIRFSFVKTSEFRGGGFELPPAPRYATEYKYVVWLAIQHLSSIPQLVMNYAFPGSQNIDYI